MRGKWFLACKENHVQMRTTGAQMEESSDWTIVAVNPGKSSQIPLELRKRDSGHNQKCYIAINIIIIKHMTYFIEWLRKTKQHQW